MAALELLAAAAPARVVAADLVPIGGHTLLGRDRVLWAPNDPDGPTVVINTGSQILQEVVEYHQAQYPDVYAEEVAKTVLHHGVCGAINKIRMTTRNEDKEENPFLNSSPTDVTTDNIIQVEDYKHRP